MDFNAWLKANGFDRETLSETQLVKLQAAWRAEQNPTPTPTPAPASGGNTEPTSYDALMAQFRAEQDREREITALAASALRDHPNQSEKIDQITKLAFAGKWTVKDTELALLRGLRWEEAPAPLSRGGREVSAKVVEAALAMACGLSEDTCVKAYGATTLEQAHSAFRNGLSISELIIATAKQNGHRDGSLRGYGYMETLRAAFRPTQMGVGFSNVSLPGILGNIGHKAIREGFDYVDQAWKVVTAFRSTNDYKEITTFNLVGDYDFQEVPKGGRLTHAEPQELAYGNRVNQHGVMLVLTKVDLVNDDLNALSSKGKKIGGGAGRFLNKKFWTEWNTLSAVPGSSIAFNAKSVSGVADNYDDGTDSAFDAEALAAATAMFRAQRIPNGAGTDTAEPLGVKPKILVVPSSVDDAARRLMRSEKVLEANEEGDANIWSNRYKLVSPEYMEEETYGGEPTQWHLIADPNELPVIETIFLNGVQTPIIETVDADSDTFGIAMRGEYNFGVRRQERRGRVTMKGAV